MPVRRLSRDICRNGFFSLLLVDLHPICTPSPCIFRYFISIGYLRQWLCAYVSERRSPTGSTQYLSDISNLVSRSTTNCKGVYISELRYLVCRRTHRHENMDIKSVTSCIDLEAIDWRHPSQKADMNSISTEILSLILEHTATAYFLDGNPCAPIYSYERIGVLAQVCRRFNNIVSGFPFRTLEFSFLYDQPIKVVPEHNFLLRRLLDRTNSPNFHRLRQHDVHDVRPRIYSDPSLGQKCRTLVVRRIVSFCMSVDCVSIVTSTLPNVVHLRYKHTEKLNRPFHAKMFSTMVKGFPRLRHLSISAQCLDRIVEACSSLPALRILEINRPLKEREDSCSIDLKVGRHISVYDAARHSKRI